LDALGGEGFRVWARDHAAALHRTAYLLCGDWHVAEDLVQESLARTALHWRRIERTGGADAYVRKVLVNQARQRWRRRRVSERLLESDDLLELPVPDGVQERVDRDQLMAALRRLPPRQRAAVVLRYFEQLSEAEAAEALGCSIGNVKSQTHRALITLRRLLAEESVS
jgi:RNA polymerase sigma-70 factor (sigma-E family)